METTWNPNPKALATWDTCDLVAFFMMATEPLLLCDDGHEMTLEAAHGRCNA